MEGSVPEELADLPLLTDLSLQMNRLSGSLPARLVQCDNWKVWQPDFTIIPQQEGSLTVEVESLYTSTDYSKMVKSSHYKNILKVMVSNWL